MCPLVRGWIREPMLRTLRIRDLAIIEEVAVEFRPGLNVLTGETGAGKSILVDAVGLLVGARAERSIVRSGARRAVRGVAGRDLRRGQSGCSPSIGGSGRRWRRTWDASWCRRSATSRNSFLGALCW